MKNSKVIIFIKKILLILSGIVIFSLLAALLYLNVKKNEIGRHLIDLVNHQIHGEVKVDRFSLASIWNYPHLDVAVHGLRLLGSPSAEKEELILAIPEMIVNTDLSEIYSGQLSVSKVHAKEVRFYLKEDVDGQMIISKAFKPVHKKEDEELSGQFSLDISDIQIRDCHVFIFGSSNRDTLVFDIKEAGGNLVLKEQKIEGFIDVDLYPLNLKQTENSLVSQVPIRLNSRYKIDLIDEILDINVTELTMAEQPYSAEMKYVFGSNPNMSLLVNSREEGIDMDQLFTEKSDSLSKGSMVDLLGTGHFRSSLFWKPVKGKSFAQAIVASFSLEGKDLLIKGLDLDGIIEKFKRSQNFNLADIGAVMFAGPAGLAVTKGTDFARLAFVNSGDSTVVRHFLAEWEFDQGILRTKDVAMSTVKNRVVTNGWYKVENDSLDFSIDVIDHRGCDLVGQRIFGVSNDLQYGKINILKTFTGPIKNFFLNLGIGKCTIVYQGRVEHPKFGQ